VAIFEPGSLIGSEPLSRMDGRVRVKPPSHAGDSAAESCRCWCYRGNIGHDAISLLSHADDGAAESFSRCRCHNMLAMALPRQCWPWHDVDAESCWR
jgi:hypothetical protein